MLTVEVELRESNPIDPVLAVYRIQKQSNRNLGHALGADPSAGTRWASQAWASGRTKVPASAGRSPCPGRREATIRCRGESVRPAAKAARDGDGPGISCRHSEYIY